MVSGSLKAWGVAQQGSAASLESLKGKMPKAIKLDSTGTSFAFQGF
jgi:hypothetical protein